MFRIGVDLMGSDSSPITLFDAILEAAKTFQRPCTLIVLATEEVVAKLQKIWEEHAPPDSPLSLEFFPAADVVTMEDSPLTAVRHKKEASLVVGVDLLQQGKLDAMVTAGNTGALVAAAALKLNMLAGIEKPALLAVLPTKTGNVVVIDVGGNVSSKAEHLVQFANMGVAYQKTQGMTTPRVGLLNIGMESKKGTAELRQAYHTLEQQSQSPETNLKISFVGNIEGKEAFEGKTDVLVTDGFAGNVFLKTAEGVSSFIVDYLSESLQNHPSPETRQVLQTLQKSVNCNEYPGAIMCGIDKVIVKCHGYSSSYGMFNAIKGAVSCLETELVESIRKQLG